MINVTKLDRRPKLEAYRGDTVGMVLTFINNDSAVPDDLAHRLDELEERTHALEHRLRRMGSGR